MDTCAQMSDMAKEYWELSNQVTGFAIVQMVSLALGASTNKALRKGIRNNWRVTIALIAAGTVMYLAIIAHCYTMELRASCDHEVFGVTNYARMILITITNAFGVYWVSKMKNEEG